MRVAVLGLGSAGARHARHLADLGATPVGWDPDEARPAPEGGERAASARAALDNADAAVIASPNSAHAEQALLAIEHGLPTLVEKPLATTAKAAERVAAAAAARGIACGVAMNLRYLPAIAELKRLVDSGGIGRILRASLWFGYDLRRWRPDSDYRASYSARSDLGGGIVLDAIHELDYMAWLLGSPTAVTATTAKVSDMDIDVEDTAVAAVEFESGAVAAVDLDFVSPAYRRGCVLTGTEAVTSWDFNEQRVLVDSGDDARTIECPGEVGDTYRAEIDDFLRVVRGDGEPAVSAGEGAAAVRLAEAIKRSAAAGERVALS